MESYNQSYSLNVITGWLKEQQLLPPNHTLTFIVRTVYTGVHIPLDDGRNLSIQTWVNIVGGYFAEIALLQDNRVLKKSEGGFEYDVLSFRTPETLFKFLTTFFKK
jgi:hypothetical protein